MRRVVRPSHDARNVFLLCVSRVRVRARRQLLEAAADDVGSAAAAFETAAASAAYYGLPRSTHVGAIDAAAMGLVYTNRMAKKGAPGRSVYDELLAAPEYGRCPLCGQRVVATLDHYLPKSIYPGLAVAPANLIPACSDCNKAKLILAPTTPETQTLHPYFDEVDHVRWLSARVAGSSPIALRYFVRQTNGLDTITRARLQYHFRTFGLGPLYGSYAAEELANLSHVMTQLRARKGASAVRRHLEEQRDSYYQIQKNSWQSALYRTLANSDLYCQDPAG